MESLEQQLESVLITLREQIIQFFEQDLLDAANSLQAQYVKLPPNYFERYSLEAMLWVGEGNLGGAKTILKEGVTLYSVDLNYYKSIEKSPNLQLFEARRNWGTLKFFQLPTGWAQICAS